MKICTDLDQSLKLAEFLPIESADMAWCNNSIKGINYTDKFSANLYTVKEMKDVFDEALVGWDKYWELIPCWSLAALFKVISNIFKYNLDYNGTSFILMVGDFEVSNKTAVDACIEMIEKLHEQKLL